MKPWISSMVAVISGAAFIGAAQFSPAVAADVTPSFAGAPTGWTTDRYQPAAFGDIGSFDYASHVLGITVNDSTASSNRPSGQQTPFYNTQGMGTPVSGGVGDSVSAYLYVPSSWLVASAGARRTDMWLVVNDPGSITDPRDFPIIGFTNNDLSDGFVGFRAWNSQGSGGWVNFTAPVLADAWNRLTITDLPGNEFQYSVNGAVQTTIAGDATDTTFNSLLMQAYNFGDPTLAGPPVANAYTADWANSVPEPASLTLISVGLAALGWRRRRGVDRGRSST